MTGSLKPPPKKVTPKLDQNIMLFVRLLRAIGMKLGSADMLNAVDAAKTVGVANKNFMYHALASSLIKRREDKPLFDQAFYMFWQNPKFHERIRDLLLPKIKSPGDEHDDGAAMLRRLSDALAAPPKDQPSANDDVKIELDTTGTATDSDRLKHKDFEMMSADEMQAALAANANLQPKLPRRSARRSKLSSRGQLIAIRAALQHAERQGGMVIPKFRSVITKPRPLVILCDISGSMEHYSRIMLHFIHALTRNHPQVSSFLFGTRLTNISRQMRHRDVDEAVQSVSHLVDDWSGGTRISASLETFNHRWSRRVMGQGAITLLITDGLDRNPDDALGIHMERLHKSTATLLWLNPLLRFDGFAPKSHSVRTMIQHVDHFLPIHSLRAMTDLTASLAKVQTQRDAKLA
ncbi:MAG TPA: VWA domain-containing protein, partial [Alphaproteobacteria bacterium]|nr:VWA domain-containing protein [Alphaproteobacteria bacterium]